MKIAPLLFFTVAALLLTACTPKQSSQSAATAPAEEKPQTEEELAQRVITKVQRIIENTDDRLSAVEPVVDTMPVEYGFEEGRVLKLWMEDNQAVKLTVTEPDDEGAMTGLSTFYFGGQDLFYASQPFARFIFLNGKLEYWLDENWTVNPMSPQLLDQREELLYNEANEYLTWFFGAPADN
ncbi:MAG: hypothetical protein GVY26_14885 [Bacteroidetes bacterium]|jgi:hypothetical protein|nr:hypothetical protein [Bacteroidota bacterium]